MDNYAYREVGCAKTSRPRREKSKNKPFIVDADARLFKGEVKLSRGAQSVYMLMRSLANGKTGELGIRGHAFNWRYLCDQGGFSRWTWLKYRQELIAAGLLWEQRDRLPCFDHKTGRSRIVLGKTHYFIRRQSQGRKTVKKSMILLKSGSPTVEEPDPQRSQKHHKLYAGAGVCSEAFVLEPALEPDHTQSSSSPSPTPKTDDDAVRVSSLEPETQPDKLTRLREKAEKIISENYPLADRELTGSIFDHIVDRILDQGLSLSIGSEKYLVQAFENFLHSREYNEVFDEFKNRIWLRQKFMPGFDASKFSDAPDEELTQRVRDAIAAKGEA